MRSCLCMISLGAALVTCGVAPGDPAAALLPQGTHATGNAPTERQVQARGVSEQLYAQLPPDLVLQRDVLYSDADDVFCRLDVIKSREAETPLPVILKFHGGGLSGGDKSWHRDVMVLWARQGFAVVSANYRMSPEYVWPAMVEDADTALRWVGGNAEAYGLDTSRVVVTGDSAGGYLAVALATFDQDLFSSNDSPRPIVRAAAGWYGAYSFVPRLGIDWQGWGTNPNWEVMPVSREADPALWELAGPINHLNPTDPPILLIHGVRDTIIPYTQSLVFSQVGWESEVMVELQILPSTEHSFRPAPSDGPTLPSQRDSLMRAAQVTLDFFVWHLGQEHRP